MKIFRISNKQSTISQIMSKEKCIIGYVDFRKTSGLTTGYFVDSKIVDYGINHSQVFSLEDGQYVTNWRLMRFIDKLVLSWSAGSIPTGDRKVAVHIHIEKEYEITPQEYEDHNGMGSISASPNDYLDDEHHFTRHER